LSEKRLFVHLSKKLNNKNLRVLAFDPILIGKVEKMRNAKLNLINNHPERFLLYHDIIFLSK